jgi:hypothetical protein
MAVSLSTAMAFLGANILIIWLIKVFSQRTAASSSRLPPAAQPAPGETAPSQTNTQINPETNSIQVSQLLGWEFEYARVTASEAMHDRHTMVNFYLLIVGVAVSATTGAMAAAVPLPNWLGAVLLWLLCGVGWLYFLKLIRLRQAWYDSARAMNQIKEFCIRHNHEFPQVELRSAFRWQASSLPSERKPWTLFFFSAMLIGFLSTSAYFVGGLMLGLQAPDARLWPLVMLALAVVFFGTYVYFYFAFLGQNQPNEVP